MPHGVRFVPNYMAGQLAQPFDLVINTLSMSEMSEYQVRRYLALMKTVWLKDGGLFFEQNMDNRPMGLQCAEALIGDVFPEQRRLRDHALILREGSPNIWSLAPIRLTGKRIESECAQWPCTWRRRAAGRVWRARFGQQCPAGYSDRSGRLPERSRGRSDEGQPPG